MTILHEIKKRLEELTHFSPKEWTVDYTVVDIGEIVFGPDGRVIIRFKVAVALNPSKDESSKDNANL